MRIFTVEQTSVRTLGTSMASHRYELANDASDGKSNAISCHKYRISFREYYREPTDAYEMMSSE